MKRYWQWFNRWGVAALFMLGWVVMPLADVLTILNYPRLSTWWVDTNALLADVILRDIGGEAISEAHSNSRPRANVVPIFKELSGPH